MHTQNMLQLWNHCGFSSMNKQKNRKQTTTTHQTLNQIMQIAVGSPDFENLDLSLPPVFRKSNKIVPKIKLLSQLC